ncbi:FtsW/RodA/SpoVE family cell cycle protein [Leptospira bouyouniensis]|uniref:Probable peptidoglycan glycosyltransferase FtsW n=1 Tax=Leptospira bouyouniensis TaxID=2484911 RepID=A0ABY2L5Z4_9LEPT|nr:FtsW/RodA/SpoVE family cell cycle protein [Leptospira bouyouniensis]TGK48331.1 cell division protein FtsW [Leptospira bouyouniensis]
MEIYRNLRNLFRFGSSRFDGPMLFFMFLLFGMGMIVMFSASVIPAEREFSDSYYYLRKQLLWGFLGLILFLIFCQIPYQFLVKWSFVLSLFSLILLVAVFIPGLGKSVGTSYGRSFNRWIQIAGFQIQPSEFSKISILLFSSYFFYNFDFKKINWNQKKIVSLVIIFLTLLLIVIEPAFGTTVELLLVLFFFVLLAGFPIKRLFILGASMIPLLLVLVTQVGYRKKRLEIWLDPYKFRFDEGHQLVTSFRAFFDGGSTGKAIGTGYAHRYLAYSHTDFVISSFVEDFGFVGFLIFISIVLFLMVRIFFLLERTKDKLGFFLGSGILILFGFQTILNLFVVTGIVPVTGISLPFLSYGGSSLLTIFILFGILANITKRENLVL